MQSQVEVPANHGNKLVVLLHAYTSTPDKLRSLRAAVEEHLPGVRVHCPALPVGLFSLANPNAIVLSLLADIDELVAKADKGPQPIEQIILIGHSIGSLLARKIYVVACGETRGAPFENEFRQGLHHDELVQPRPWAVKVSRMILLAGVNRGWWISHHMGLLTSLKYGVGSLLGHAIRLTGKTLLIFAFRTGAEFIVQLRIQWLYMRPEKGAAGPDRKRALTVQLLGSRDDIVAPSDNIDLVSGSDFVYLDIPYSGHADVIDMADPRYGEGRKTVFTRALIGNEADLRRSSMIPADDRFAAPDLHVKRVVFVIHGIRDVGYWTQKIARQIKSRAAAHGKLHEWATETSSYGYFPMLPFLLPWYRRRKVEWLMDQYTENLARYPNASFSFVGHSNGTYLLAKALELYPCCHFDNVVFAGSVVRRSYEWRQLLQSDPPRVGAVLNFVASRDWVVAFFPKLFQDLHLQDLGSAGHDGFIKTKRDADLALHQVEYVRGAHSAAIQESVWQTIADFVVDGKINIGTAAVLEKRREFLVAFLGRFPLLVWAGLLLFAYVIWQGIEMSLGLLFPDPGTRSFALGAGFVTYMLLLWLIVTRV